MNWHPHLHVLAPAGAFRTDGVFVHSPVFDAAVLRDLFQANVLALLLKERMISQELVERMREWRHSGFHAYTGEEIRRVYEVDPLLCPCGQKMRVVGFIAQAPVIRKILAHIGRRFDPLKLPGRSPPLLDDLFPNPFPDYGPQ